jgi:hypothetical protein
MGERREGWYGMPHVLPFPLHDVLPVPQSVHDASSIRVIRDIRGQKSEAFGRPFPGMIRGERPRLHPIPFVSVRVHSWLPDPGAFQAKLRNGRG